MVRVKPGCNVASRKKDTLSAFLKEPGKLGRLPLTVVMSHWKEELTHSCSHSGPGGYTPQGTQQQQSQSASC